MLLRSAKSVQNGAGFSGKLEQTGPSEMERVASVPQREQLAKTPEPPLPKEKGIELSVQSTRSWREESQDGREMHLGEREEDQSESMDRKGWTPTKADSKEER